GLGPRDTGTRRVPFGYGSAADQGLAMSAPRHAGASVFLVEDEVMIRMMVADMLEELGYRIAAEAGDVPEALKLARTTEFDLADVNLDGHVITPVAEAIKK